MPRRRSRGQYSDDAERRTREAKERLEKNEHLMEDTERCADLHVNLREVELSAEASELINTEMVNCRERVAEEFRREANEFDRHQQESSDYAGELGEVAERGRDAAMRLERTQRDAHVEQARMNLNAAERGARDDAHFFETQRELLLARCAEHQRELDRLEQRANHAAQR
jgi:phosphatidate phosphatase PAH1